MGNVSSTQGASLLPEIAQLEKLATTGQLTESDIAGLPEAISNVLRQRLLEMAGQNPSSLPTASDLASSHCEPMDIDEEYTHSPKPRSKTSVMRQILAAPDDKLNEPRRTRARRTTTSTAATPAPQNDVGYSRNSPEKFAARPARPARQRRVSMLSVISTQSPALVTNNSTTSTTTATPLVSPELPFPPSPLTATGEHHGGMARFLAPIGASASSGPAWSTKDHFRIHHPPLSPLSPQSPFMPHESRLTSQQQFDSLSPIPLALSATSSTTGTSAASLAPTRIERRLNGPVSGQKLIPTTLYWTHGGSSVYVTGTFNQFKHKIRMDPIQRGEEYENLSGGPHIYRVPPDMAADAGELFKRAIDSNGCHGEFKPRAGDFRVSLFLPAGTHYIKFIVDNKWTLSHLYDWLTDEDGDDVEGSESRVGYGRVNLIHVDLTMSRIVTNPTRTAACDVSLEDIDTNNNSSYNNNNNNSNGNGSNGNGCINNKLQKTEPIEGIDDPYELLDSRACAQPPPGDYHNEIPPALLISQPIYTDGSDGRRRRVLEPPALPPHLQSMLLNVDSDSNDPSALTMPLHVHLGHLYASPIVNDVVSLSVTTRYRSKFITSVLYRPL